MKQTHEEVEKSLLRYASPKIWITFWIITWGGLYYNIKYPPFPNEQIILNQLNLLMIVALIIMIPIFQFAFWKVRVTPRYGVGGIDLSKLVESINYQESLNHHEFLKSIYNPSKQYVYIIRDVELTGLYKIGKSKSLNSRLYDFGVKLPFEFHIVHLIPCDDVDWLECDLHQKYSHKRLRGEWFNLSDEDIQALRLLH